MPAFACTAYSIADSVAVNDEVNSFLGCVSANKTAQSKPKKTQDCRALNQFDFPILSNIDRDILAAQT
jgi:hypothetical protein